MKDYSVIIAGFGGQGVLSAGMMLAQAGVIENREVSWFPSYGPEMRGGTANCAVILSDEPIGSPIIGLADAVIALNEPSADKFEPMLSPGGLLLTDATLVKRTCKRDDIRYLPIEASAIANELGNMAYATVVLLGCLAKSDGCFLRDSFESALTFVLPERRHHMISNNLLAFDRGFKLC